MKEAKQIQVTTNPSNYRAKRTNCWCCCVTS